MSADAIDIAEWPDQLEQVLAERCTTFRRAHVLAETDSTQNEPDRLGALPGDVIVAGRQTRGRGRLGRAWSQDSSGVAITFVMAPGQTTRLSIALGVAAAGALESIMGRGVKLKWPNDVYAEGRKLAGILVEQNDRRALPAVGVNVHQQSWPADLTHKAISLAQLGCSCERIDVMEAVIVAFDESQTWTEKRLEHEFIARDLLTGCLATIGLGQDQITGEVVSVRPFDGLTLRTADGERFAPAANAQVISFEPRNG